MSLQHRSVTEWLRTQIVTNCQQIIWQSAQNSDQVDHQLCCQHPTVSKVAFKQNYPSFLNNAKRADGVQPWRKDIRIPKLLTISVHFIDN